MISAEVRRTVRTLYVFACGYCGVTEVEVGAYLTIDHYQPREAQIQERDRQAVRATQDKKRLIRRKSRQNRKR